MVRNDVSIVTLVCSHLGVLHSMFRSRIQGLRLRDTYVQVGFRDHARKSRSFGLGFRI
jgi:hypothetical protein